MTRRLLYLVSVLLPLMCVAAALLWIRSYSCHDRLMFTTASGRAIVETYRGHVAITLSLGGGWTTEKGVAFDAGVPAEEATNRVDQVLGIDTHPYTLVEGCGVTWLCVWMNGWSRSIYLFELLSSSV